ncbi:MAG: hypothetical protein WAK18_14820 [Nocardioidaceae bacterium]
MTDERRDLTPPDPEPMSDERKREIRAQLLATTGTAPQTSRRSWLVPGLAAAAVAAILATGVYLANNDGSSRSTKPLQPADGAGTSTSPAGPVAPSPADTTVTAEIAPPTYSSTGPPPAARPPENCADAVNELIQRAAPPLAGATETASRAGGIGTTYLYESKAAWVVCDDFASVDGGAPTLLSWHLKSDPYLPTAKTVGISENAVGKPGHLDHQYVAGGRDFDGVRAISYAFPDGHTEDAVVGQNGLWSMNYQPTTGVLVDPTTNERTLDPIKVTVSYTASAGGGTDTFTLQWGLGTCGQTNHGC